MQEDRAAAGKEDAEPTRRPGERAARTRNDRLALTAFIASAVIMSFVYGALSMRLPVFPHDYLNDILDAFRTTFRDDLQRYVYIETDLRPKDSLLVDDGRQAPGLTLLQYIGGDRKPAAAVVDLEGQSVQKWDLDWFRVWPDATHLTEDELPKQRPGTHAHGALVADNGDLIFNYENRGLVRMNACGGVVWRLPYETSHSVAMDDEGNLWVPARRVHREPDADYSTYVPPFDEPMVLKVSPDGRILREISVFDVLRRNHLEGLLYPGQPSEDFRLSGDVLHLNDVQVFPSGMKPGVFKPGDVMISLRNIDTVVVFDPGDLSLRWYSTGMTSGQHDPDFVDGDTVILFDNDFPAPSSGAPGSAVVALSAATGARHVLYEASASEDFFSWMMGNVQRLPQGHLLITDTMQGKAFEVDREGNTVWRYINFTGAGTVGIVELASRLPTRMTSSLFERDRAACEGVTAAADAASVG